MTVMSNPFVDPLAFILAVLSHWFTLLAGCVVTVVINWVERHLLKGKKIPGWVEVSVLVIFLFFASFQAWRDQYREAAKANERLAELSAPMLTGSIKKVMEGPTGANGDDCLVIAIVTITNTGAPSVVPTFNSKIRLKDGREFPIIFDIAIPNGDTIIPVLQLPPGTSLNSADELSRKALAQPIPTGGATTGFLIGTAQGVTYSESFRPGTLYVLDFTDVTGKIN